MKSRPLYLVCLVAAPAVLLAIELFHPANFTTDPGMYQYLSKPEPYDPKFDALAYPGPGWWFVLHMIQTPLVGLVAIGVWLLVGRVEPGDGLPANLLAWLSRIAAFLFLIYYTALDSIGGFGLGRAMLNTEALATATPPRLSAAQVDGIRLLLDTNWQDPWVGGVGSFISLLGSWAIFVAALAAALALLLARRAYWLPLIVFVAFGWELQVSHASPHGPVAFALLIVAALWLWWTEKPRA